MKLLTSDFHLANHQEFSHTSADGVNSRLELQIQTVEEIYGIAIKEEVDDVYILGDIFNKRGTVEPEAVNLFKRTVKRYRIPTKILTGNHDIVLEGEVFNSAAVLDGFENNIKVVSHIEYSAREQSLFVPYTVKDFEEHVDKFLSSMFAAKSKRAFQEIKRGITLFMHQDVEGEQYDRVVKNLVSMSYLKDFNLVCNGHIHAPRKRGNLVILGSPYHMNFGDSGKRYCYIYNEVEGRIVQQIELKRHPKFVTVHKASDIKKDGNFYRLITDKKVKPEDIKDADVRAMLTKDIVYRNRVQSRNYKVLIKQYAKDEGITDVSKLSELGIELFDEANAGYTPTAHVQYGDISFESIRAANFMQYEKLSIDFENGVHQIYGKNRTGKSSIVESLFWCVYGVTARSTNNVVRYGENQCEVVVSGHKNGKRFDISRAKGKINGIKFHIDGKLKDSGTIPLNQKLVEEFLGIDKVNFLSSILFGHNSFRFSKARDSERKSVLETLPALQFEQYLNARSIALQESKKLFDALLSDQSKLDYANEYNAKMKASKIAEKNKEIAKVNARIKSLGKVVDWSKQIEKLEESQEASSLEVQMLEKDIIKYANLKISKVCPTCGNKIDEKHMQKHIKDTDKKLKIAKNAEAAFTKELRALYAKQDKFIQYKEMNDEIEELKSSVEKIKKEKTGDTAQMSTLKRRISQNTKKRELYDFWVKGFGNSGVIGLLTDSFIDDINVRLIEISETMTDGAILAQYSSTTTTKKGTNLEKISLVCFTDGQDTLYENLSNSEQQRIDIMTMFAFKEYYETEGTIDVVFFDEVFEGLDEESNTYVMNYIDRVFNKKKCYLMSHMPDIRLDIDSLITIKKEDGKSVLVEKSL